MQDITKTGAEYAKLKQRVRAIPRSFGRFRSPLEELRDLVPPIEQPEKVYKCDPDLILEDCKEAWDREYGDAQKLMDKFNGELSDAIKLGKQLGMIAF
jgi:hypothetical protein